MVIKLDNVKKFLGKSILDSDGVPIGKIMGFHTNIKGEIISIGIELNDGNFEEYPSSYLATSEDSITLLKDWELETKDLEWECELIIKRMNAIQELYDSGELQKEIYEDMKAQHELVLKELKERSKELIGKLNDVKESLNKQVKTLETFFTSNKIQHSSGEIDDGSYRIVIESIRNGLKKVIANKQKLEKSIENLSDIESLALKPNSEFLKQNLEKKGIPQDIVLVQVKDGPL
ncbi:MAG: CdvA-like protein [Candidatus Bathyarchaeia archaeon]